MKIECTQDKLSRALAVVSHAVGTRTTLPVLANIMLKTENGRLRLSATNLEIGVSTFVVGKVDDEGDITLPARILQEFVTTNSDATITISTKDSDAILKSQHYKATIKGIPASEFPTIPQVSPEFEAEVNGSKFKQALAQTIYAAALDETRPVLAGVLMRVSGNEMKLAATDSYRLAEKTMPLDKKVEKSIEVVIPARTMLELARLIDDGDGVLNIKIGENQIAFSIGDNYLVSRIIEGAYPDYEQIIPKESPITALVKKGELANAMKMSALFARDTANNIKLKFAGKELEVLAESPQLGENHSTMPADIKGGELDISFNAKYILDGLPVIEGEEIEISLVGKLNPCVIKSPNDKTFVYIVMPLRVET